MLGPVFFSQIFFSESINNYSKCGLFSFFFSSFFFWLVRRPHRYVKKSRTILEHSNLLDERERRERNSMVVEVKSFFLQITQKYGRVPKKHVGSV